MKLIAGALNGESLDALHRAHTPLAKDVQIAVPYADNSFVAFLELAASKNVPLTFYGRYDTSLPVALPVIEWFLDNKWRKTAECSLVPDFFHPKIIWWRGRGAYIGSANLSHRAWNQNIEVGTFFTELELTASGIGDGLAGVFAQIRERAFPINKDLREKMKALSAALEIRATAEKRFENEAEKHRWIPKGSPLGSGKTPAGATQDAAYIRRRAEVIEYMSELGELLTKDANRPSWLPISTPKYLLADQFLYAFGEQFPGNKGRSDEEVMATNRLRNSDAIKDAVNWWASGNYKYEKLRHQLVDVRNSISELFARQRIRTLSQEEFVEAFTQIHAVGERARNRANADLKLPKGAPQQQRLMRHAEQVWEFRSKGGKTVLDLLDFVIWGDVLYPLPERIRMGAQSDMYKLREILENTLSDIVGWVRPDIAPPINGRTFKELKMLGFELDAKDLEDSI